MSKIRILMAGLLVLAMSTPALAFTVTWSGDFNQRAMYTTQGDLARYTVLSREGWIADYMNVDTVTMAADTKKNDKDSDFFVEVKYRLWATAADETGKVKGVIGLEFGGTKFGQEPVNGLGGADFGGDDNNLEVMHMYTDFEAPFDPATRIRIGIQPAVYNNLLWIDNAAGVKMISTRGALNYSLGWFRDNVTNSGALGGAARDTADDVFAADVNYKLTDGTALNAFALYYDDNREAWGAASGVPVVDDTKIWVGGAAKGQVGRLFWGGTAIYEFGEAEARDGAAFAGGTELDRSAFLLNAEATYKFNGLSLRGGWLYASGDDDHTDDELNNFSSIDPYMGWYGSVVFFDSYADDNSLVTAPYVQDKGLNMGYLVANYALNDRTNLGASYLWINAAEDLSNFGGDKDMGNEFNVSATYMVTKNLQTGIQAGYFIGGDAWDSLASDGDGDDVFRTDASVRLRF